MEIIAYCENHGVQRKARLRKLGITEWNFYIFINRHRNCMKLLHWEPSGLEKEKMLHRKT